MTGTLSKLELGLGELGDVLLDGVVGVWRGVLELAKGSEKGFEERGETEEGKGAREIKHCWSIVGINYNYYHEMIESNNC